MARILYLHGFASGPQSRKARFFREQLAEAGCPLEIPDLTAGDFEHLTIGGQLRVIQDLAAGNPVTLIGSSLGGYLAALYASQHEEVERLVLLAPAFEFAEHWGDMLGADKMAEWRRTGKLPIYSYAAGAPRELGFQIYEESRLWPSNPAFSQPARIFHGTADTVVPADISERYAAAHPNVEITLLNSDHELIDALPEIWRRVRDFL